ncbi:hypothetical protein ABE236_18100 [Priestia endophytica]|uniref:hypothetical protein n=1 Tax=Priestia endophytica TaxID=135735 RepID=UPI003D2A352D
MYKGKAKTRIILDKAYQKGQTVELTDEQAKLLAVYFTDLVEVKEQKEVKPKRASTRKTKAKE